MFRICPKIAANFKRKQQKQRCGTGAQREKKQGLRPLCSVCVDVIEYEKVHKFSSLNLYNFKKLKMHTFANNYLQLI
jgi:hypothetical protein